MQEQENPSAPREVTGLPEDRERDLGFRGGAYSSAAWLLGSVFATGMIIVAFVVLKSRRPRR